MTTVRLSVGMLAHIETAVQLLPELRAAGLADAVMEAHWMTICLGNEGRRAACTNRGD